jgi:predicted ArsR family transcriptional regulator
MSNPKTVFRKTKEIHYQIGGHPEIAVGSIASALELSTDEVKEHLTSLKNLRLVRFKDTTNDTVEVTKIGLSTMVGESN